jgi:hypothetical protein
VGQLGPGNPDDAVAGIPDPILATLLAGEFVRATGAGYVVIPSNSTTTRPSTSRSTRPTNPAPSWIST